MNKSTRPEPPREAALIEAARRRLKLSIRRAAPMAGLGDARWRQITSGYQSVSGNYIEVKGPAETLARMARVVGVSAEDLEGAGRKDAAEALKELTASSPSRPTGPYTPPVDAVYEIMAALPPEAQEEVIRRLGHTLPAPSPEEAEPGHERHTG